MNISDILSEEELRVLDEVLLMDNPVDPDREIREAEAALAARRLAKTKRGVVVGKDKTEGLMLTALALSSAVKRLSKATFCCLEYSDSIKLVFVGTRDECVKEAMRLRHADDGKRAVGWATCDAERAVRELARNGDLQNES